LLSAAVDHVIVLALENRSFDHMIGFLNHPDPHFDGLDGVPCSNPGWSDGEPISPTADAKTVLPFDPDHSHDAVMEQLAVVGRGALRHATNAGFVSSYERKGRGLAAPAWDGVLAPILGILNSTTSSSPVLNRGPEIMRCQPSDHVPVLSALAVGFAVCTRWFASVPGETWPNRNFMHAATSDGTTNIEVRFYDNRTIFELLEEHGRTWHIYYDDTPQVWAFDRLWEEDKRRACWFEYPHLLEHVRSGTLPHYSFVEPNHRPPLHVPPYEPGVGSPDLSNSQHPGNNLVADSAYDAAPHRQDGDFGRAERLVAQIYEALRANPSVFEKTLLIVTYDEHGGTYDHVPPPMDVPAPGPPSSESLLTRLLHFLLRRKSQTFDFTSLGVRVPAVIISPHIPAATVCTTIRDHSTIPATLRTLFAPEAAPLSFRDAWAHPVHHLLTLPNPRTDSLPDLSEFAAVTPAPSQPPPTSREPALPEHYEPLFGLADMVDQGLPGPNAPVGLAPRARANFIIREFTEKAVKAREE
jgi:phospholipase C